MPWGIRSSGRCFYHSERPPMRHFTRRDTPFGWPIPCVVAMLLLSAPAGSSALMAEEQATLQRITGKRLTVSRDARRVIVNQGERLLVQYRYGGLSHKPYIAQLTSPSGVNVVRDAPADHLHHHGMMFAWSVGGVNFWEERPDSGREVHDQWRQLRIAAVRPTDGQETESSELAILRERLRWEGPDGKVLLVEDRVLTVPATTAGEACLLTWQSTFTTPDNGKKVAITGASYNGLGARFLKAMDTGGRFLNEPGGQAVDGTNGKQAKWCAYTAQPSPGRPVTVAMFDARSNPRHPATWFTMDRPFAYLAATLDVENQPLQLHPGQRLTLRYGVAVFDTAIDKQAIDAVYTRWAAVADRVP